MLHENDANLGINSAEKKPLPEYEKVKQLECEIRLATHENCHINVFIVFK